MCEFMSCLDVMSGLSAWPSLNGSEQYANASTALHTICVYVYSINIREKIHLVVRGLVECHMKETANVSATELSSCR